MIQSDPSLLPWSNLIYDFFGLDKLKQEIPEDFDLEKLTQLHKTSVNNFHSHQQSKRIVSDSRQFQNISMIVFFSAQNLRKFPGQYDIFHLISNCDFQKKKSELLQSTTKCVA